MATIRVSKRSTAPTTDYNLYADLMSQDQAGNFSTVYYWVQAINRGNSSSFSNNSGSQTGEIAGAGGGGHSGTMPSGYATGAQRWYDGPWSVNITHDAAGNHAAVSTVQRVRGWFTYDDAGSSIALPRIPKPPSIPGAPVASNILPTSMRITWTAPTDEGGSTIDHYLLQRFETADGTGPVINDVLTSAQFYRDVTGLLPGKQYSWRVFAHNGSSAGYSPSSAVVAAKTMAPFWVKVGGIWKYGVPYVKVAGVWKIGLPFVKVSGIWKSAS